MNSNPSRPASVLFLLNSAWNWLSVALLPRASYKLRVANNISGLLQEILQACEMNHYFNKVIVVSSTPHQGKREV